jgi:hypothetical protein
MATGLLFLLFSMIERGQLCSDGVAAPGQKFIGNAERATKPKSATRLVPFIGALTGEARKSACRATWGADMTG